jgi:outer membrane receptor for monomeric catechols
MQHSLSTGVEFMHERQSSIAITAATDTVGANLYNPDVNGPFLPLVPNGGFSNGTTLTAAVYAFDTLKLNEQWQLNGGLRWEKFRTDFDSATYTAAAGTTPASLVQNAPQSLADSLSTWKLGALYKPVANGSIYASASTSMQPPGGANVTLSSTATNINNPNLSPQEANNLELGAKWDLAGGALALTGAVFRSENKNEIVTDAALGESVQAGKRRVQGMELGAVGQISPAWSASAGLALLKAEVLRGSTAAATGTLIPFTPEQSLTMWSTYKLPSGFEYSGEWVEGEITGQGTARYPNGSVYEGTFLKGQPEGKGKITAPDGRTYEGDWVQGQMTGQGVARYANGAIYEGAFSRGQHNGTGKLTNPSGYTYEGDWVLGVKEGTGKITYPDGATYQGTLVKGQRSGKGKL